MTEVSAGGVVVSKNKILLIKDRNRNWTFPKGIIEKGEGPLTAARREIKEEVGLSGLKLLKKLTLIRYIFTRNGPVHKTVHYFLFAYEGDTSPKPQTEEGISEARWVPPERAYDIIGYPKTNKSVLEEVKWILNTHQTSKK